MLMLGRKPVSPLCMPYAGFEEATNCILEIPQNIKLELSGNNINILLGSTVVIPNGDVYTTATTKTYPSSYTTKTAISPSNKYVVIFWNTGAGCVVAPIESVFSGNTQPTTTYTRSYWYNTNDKFLYFTNNTGQTWEKSVNGWAFPVCIVEEDSLNNWQFAKDSNGNNMIFNGAGFIGHHAFVYPNVKALSGIGISTNGKYNSQIDTTNIFSIIELNSSSPTAGYSKVLYFGAYGTAYSSAYYREVETIEERNTDTTGYRLQYVKENNTTYTYTNNGFETRELTSLVTYAYDGTTVTDFTIQKPLTKYRWVVKLIP